LLKGKRGDKMNFSKNTIIDTILTLIIIGGIILGGAKDHIFFIIPILALIALIVIRRIRIKDDKLHIDEIDDEPITAKNIIIQEAKTKVIDNVGRLDIQLIGEGQGKYITNGKVIDIKWVKKTREDKTLYYTLEGNEIILNPGVTWIQIVDLNPNIIIE